MLQSFGVGSPDARGWPICLGNIGKDRAIIDERTIRTRYEALRPYLDERGRRLFAAVEAQTAGYGGVAAVARVRGSRAAPPSRA